MFKDSHIYFRIRKGEAQITHVESGQSETRACDALAHPRTLMGDFYEIESCLKELVKQVVPKSLLSSAPIAIVQLLDASEGDYTNVEIRAFREAVLGAGAKRVFFPESKLFLSASEIKNKKFVELRNNV